MKLLILKPISVILVLCLLAAVLLSTLSSPVFLLSLFNSMVLAIAVGSCSRNSAEDQVDGCGGGGVWSSFQFSSSYRGAGDGYSCYDAVRNDDHDDGGGENEDDVYCEARNEDGCDNESKDDGLEEEDEEELEYGYDEDDDDDGSEGEVGWEDEGDCEEEDREEEVEVVVVEEVEEEEEEDDGMDEVEGGEVVDDNFEKRAEEFITKVTRGWRDEFLRDHQTRVIGNGLIE